jgi:hypothetical protein
MTEDDNVTYCRRRASEERSAASSADHNKGRAAHLTLAAFYDSARVLIERERFRELGDCHPH